jgi:hypothetical protein
VDFGCLSSNKRNNFHIMQRQPMPRRFTKTNPCPVCGGHDSLVRGKGVRCFGYLDDTGAYARCTREDRAGGLPQNADGTYSHRLNATCRCGQGHGDARAREHRAIAAPSVLRRRKEQCFRSYFTLAAFLRERYGEGTRITPWVYRDGDGCEVFRVLRIDTRAPNGEKAKSYRPCHQGEDGRWRLSRPNGLLPLYNLPAVLAAPPVGFVTLLEGEKCADIASAIGLPCATTSAHGAKAPLLTNWSPLAGRHVAILRDAGDDGEGYASKVAAILAGLDPPAEARAVLLPGLGDGEDIEQWAAARRLCGVSDAEILAELLALIDPPA